ncbi:MAG: dNTP triphosphohydrolase [Prevotellaceae bacterium]|nr:dNTP triphosphohydrolase [Candidatus Faecinaster equi]
MEGLYLNLDNTQKDEIKKQYDSLKHEILKLREYAKNDDIFPKRDCFMRDYARILYSPSFRRLQGKMQILGIQSSAFYRNRLTHSLEVSQIAISIARLLADSCDRKSDMYSDDLFVLEAAALAHDIGHPAFGHKGERVLNEVSKTINFEGNAQNFRILRTLERKEPEINGLNLTNRTLLAINKYIIDETKGKEKFMYHEDFEYMAKIRKAVGLENVRTLDVQIIEIADDIAYAVHDLEDGLALRKFTIDEIIFQLHSKYPEDTEGNKLFNDIVAEAKENANKPGVRTVQDHSKILRMMITSQLTDEFIKDITLSTVSKSEAEEHGTKKDVSELMLNRYKKLLKNLKKVIFECITRDDDINLYEARGEIVIRSLYEVYSDDKLNDRGKLMPPDYRPVDCNPKCFNKSLAQNSIDYIAGMMDTFAIQEYERLFHRSFEKIDVDKLKDYIHK